MGQGIAGYMQDYRDEIMDETEGPALCYRATRAVTDELYSDYIERVKASIKQYGEFRLLIAYKNFPGWDEPAAVKDLPFYAEYGKYMKKLALVNAPDKEIMAKILRKNIIGGEMKLFTEDKLQDALRWIKE